MKGSNLHNLAARMPALHGRWKRLRSLYRRIVYRTSLLKAAQKGPVRVVIGSNGVFQPGWHPTEADFLDLLRPAQWEEIFSRHPVEAVLAEHVWEHLTEAQGLEAARTCFRFLMPGGTLRAAVPDGLHPDPQYHNWTKPGGCGPSADGHKLFYTYHTFCKVFEQAGFAVELLEYFDERGEFHATDWDPSAGRINRSLRFDRRNADGKPHYTSIILDATKPK